MESLCLVSSGVNISRIDPTKVSWTGTANPWGRTGCLTDLAGAAISLAYAALAPCIALCVKRAGCRIRSTDVSEKRFASHLLRAFLVTTLVILLIFELGDYFVTMENINLPIHAALTPTSQILAILGGLILHNVIENRSLAVVLVLETAVWIASAGWRFSKMIFQSDIGLDWQHTSYVICAALFLTCVFLAITDALTMYIELRLRKCSYRINRKYNSNQPSKTACYKHNEANAFSQMTFWWLNLLLWQGYKEPLELEDLGTLPTEENASTQFKRFIKIYDKEKASSKEIHKKASLWKCFFQYIWPNYCLGGILKLLGDSVGLVGPLGISVIIDYTATYKISNTTETSEYRNLMTDFKVNKPYSTTLEEFLSNGYIMGIIVFLAALAQGTLSQSSTHFVNIEGIRLKSAIQSLIYDKYLRLAQWSANDVQFNNAPDDSAKSFEGIIKPEPKDASFKTKKRLSIIKDENIDGSSITNLISEDSFNIMSFVWIGHYIWAIPLKIGVLMYFLYQKLGISAIIGATVCIFIMTPLQFLIGKSMSTNSKSTAERSDTRMMKINELLQGIKILKMHAWEFFYCDKVLETREKELQLLNKDSFYWALITFLTHASSVLITLLTFGIYFLIEEEQMTPANVFSGLALFNQLTVPLFIFPVTVPIVISALVSTRRLEEFLASPEINEKRDLIKTSSTEITDSKKDLKSSSSGLTADAPRSPSYFLTNIEETEEENENEEIFTGINSDKESVSGSSIEDLKASNLDTYAVKISKGLFSWGSGEDALSKISIVDCVTIPKGKLTMVVGKTGSGKSSFLSALIGEMNQLEGKLTWGSDSAPLAYAPQRPWLLNASIRDNVTLVGGGGSRRTRRYRRALTACSLRTDLTALPLKDLTEVGEGGAALSGGQKQRVALARALYSPAKVLLLDDPLAALDQPVAHKIFERGIKKMCIEKGRTVIMVTHKLQLLSHADQIIYVDNGKVRSMGSLANVETMEPELAMEWKSLLSRGRLEEPREGIRERTPRERWQLVRLVNRFSLQLKSKHEDDLDHRGDEAFFPSFIPLRKRFPTYHGSRYFTHDLLLPSDECDDEALRSTAPKRSSTRRHKLSQNTMERVGSRKHKTAERSSSLQVSKHRVKPAPMSRQASSPTIHCNPNADADTNLSRTKQPGDNGQKMYLLRNLFPVSQQKLIESQVDGSQITRQRSLINRLLSRSASKTKNPVISPNAEKEHTPVRRLISTNSNISEDFPDDDTFCADAEASDKLTTDEEREYGTIPKRIYLEYFKSCGIVAGSSYLISAVAWQCLRVYTDIWLSEWSGSSRNINAAEDNTMKKYFTVYAILSIASILMSLASNAVGQYAGALARKTLHIKLINNIIRCPMTFFETTPLGRIINRFSTDIGIIDKKIATSIQRLLQFLFLCLSAILINAAITPWFLIIALPICLVYYIVQKFYRCSSRELQRLDAITKSPVFSHFNETLGGLSSIRAYGQQERFVHLLWTKMDVNTNAFIILNSSNRWLGIALDYLGGFIVFAAVNAALLTAKMYPETVTPSLVGLAINYTLLVPIYLNWVVKFLSDMEMYMSAVERVQQYSSLPTENYKENGVKLPKSWPNKGEITFSGVSLRYGTEKEPVVNKIDLHIPGGQKLAICGRTGSGKSSLLLALLRMVEACEGVITIDGLDIRTLPLRELRSRIASAPQDGALFSGTIRENLVPGDRKSQQPLDDARIWGALKDAKLSSTISAYPGALDGSVVEGGAGWSGGERQLVGVARVLLKDSTLLLLDEPTASLDPATESAVLSTLTPSSSPVTIITIAHRLCTVMDYDRVIVMDGGRIVEDGPPKELLSRPMSIFSSMVRSADQ